ncbi:MAG TPA: AraC family transcriptional regulator [Longimicrobium sp.]|nr:AraC family transcriptional regulator [Longimicrobium sp.]
MDDGFLSFEGGVRALERTIGRVELEEVILPPGFALRAHVHDRAHLCLVLDGGFEERQRSGAEWCPAGTLRLSPAGDRHDLRFGPAGGRCLVVVATPELEDNDRLPLPLDRLYLREDALAARLAEVRRALREDDDASPLVVETAVLEVLAQAARPRRLRAEARPPRWLREVADRLRAQAASPPTLAEIAAQAGMHRVYVARAFRLHFGCAPGEYVRRLRVDRARHLLLGTDHSLPRVALEAGFADQAHMTRQVKQLLGITPGALRAHRSPRRAG